MVSLSTPHNTAGMIFNIINAAGTGPEWDLILAHKLDIKKNQLYKKLSSFLYG